MFQQLEVWRDHIPRSPTAQMALDEAILFVAQAPTLRLYSWAAPAVTFGYSQRQCDVLPIAGELPTVRRCTGGGIVLHGSDLTLALAIPKDDSFCSQAPQILYKNIHQWLLEALNMPLLRLATLNDCVTGGVCFESPALHDILWGNIKVGGGALRRSNKGILYQGSLRLELRENVFDIARPFAFKTTAETFALSLEHGKYRTQAWNQKR